MTNKKQFNVTIVGGGSAGWMTASYLSKRNPDFNITLIESSDIPVIGVGEATIAVLTRFIAALGLKDIDWMSACNASYKYAIKFENWHHIGNSYWHPFEAIPFYKSGVHMASYWLYEQMSKGKVNRDALYNDCFLSVELLKQNKVPRQWESQYFWDDYTIGRSENSFTQRVPYAYHFDAGLFGDFIKKHVAIPCGVKHIIDDVTEIHLNELGFISQIDTKGGKKLTADLFVDCSGFKSLLLNKTLNVDFDSYADTLFCDSALAMQIPYEDKEKEMRPYTTASALSSGWVWNTPLTSRIGTGYVYCSSFKSDNDAEEEYRNFLGAERVKDLSVRKINISTGKYKKTWHKNCVAIGLSSGFVEPLESTGIHFIQAAIEKLSVAISSGTFNNADVTSFNWFVETMMEEVKQFLGIHYGLTDREDTSFWQNVKYNTNLEIGDLPEILSKAKYNLPLDCNGLTFQNNSWVAVLNGMNYLPTHQTLPPTPPRDLNIQLAFMREFAAFRKNLLNNSLGHKEILDKMMRLKNK